MTKTYGRIDEFKSNAFEARILTPPSKNAVFFSNIENLRAWVDDTLNKGPLAYVTGGFQGSFAQMQLMYLLKESRLPVLLGLESDEFIRRKGREPILILQERIELWKHIAPDNSAIFLVDELIHARLNRCCDKDHLLIVNFGLHTSEYR